MNSAGGFAQAILRKRAGLDVTYEVSADIARCCSGVYIPIFHELKGEEMLLNATEKILCKNLGLSEANFATMRADPLAGQDLFKRIEGRASHALFPDAPRDFDAAPGRRDPSEARPSPASKPLSAKVFDHIDAEGDAPEDDAALEDPEKLFNRVADLMSAHIDGDKQALRRAARLLCRAVETAGSGDDEGAMHYERVRR